MQQNEITEEVINFEMAKFDLKVMKKYLNGNINPKSIIETLEEAKAAFPVGVHGILDDAIYNAKVGKNMNVMECVNTTLRIVQRV